MSTIHVAKLIGTTNAILHPFGMEVYEEAKRLLRAENKVTIDLSGVRNATRAFFHAAVGNLYKDLGEAFHQRVEIAGAEKREDWQEKINDAIEVVKNPNRQTETQREIAALFED